MGFSHVLPKLREGDGRQRRVLSELRCPCRRSCSYELCGCSMATCAACKRGLVPRAALLRDHWRNNRVGRDQGQGPEESHEPADLRTSLDRGAHPISRIGSVPTHCTIPCWTYTLSLDRRPLGSAVRYHSRWHWYQSKIPASFFVTVYGYQTRYQSGNSKAVASRETMCEFYF